MIPVVQPLLSQKKDLAVEGLQTTGIQDQVVPSCNSTLPENVAGKKQGWKSLNSTYFSSFSHFCSFMGSIPKGLLQ